MGNQTCRKHLVSRVSIHDLVPLRGKNRGSNGSQLRRLTDLLTWSTADLSGWASWFVHTSSLAEVFAEALVAISLTVVL